MPTQGDNIGAIDTTFSAEIIADSNSGWLCVQMPGSAEILRDGQGGEGRRHGRWSPVCRVHAAGG
jgi:hypothetical protein